MADLEYNGIPSFRRPRHLSENEFTRKLQDRVKPTAAPDERAEAVDELYTDLARIYLKGESLKEGLALMEPSQWIPIEEGADQVAAAARRRAPEESVDGTRITFSMFQKAIEDLLAKRQEIASILLKANEVPASTERTSKTTSSDGTDFISEFLKGNGIAGSLLAALTIAPFQNIGFQVLTVEEGTKAVFTTQMISGIAILLSLGMQAKAILDTLEGAGILVPEVQGAVERLAADPSARDEALKEVGIDPEELLRSQKVPDAETLVQYTKEYSARHGGVFQDFDHLVNDHWLAYASVASSQSMLRDALNSAPGYSPKFHRAVISTAPETGESPVFQIGNIFASGLSHVGREADLSYDQIANAFLFQIDDRLLCCLVSVMGSVDPSVLRTLARVLRILSLDLNGIIIGMHDRIQFQLSDYLSGVIIDLMDEINRFYGEAVSRLTRALDVTGTEQCPGLFLLAQWMLRAPEFLKKRLNALLGELTQRILGITGHTQGAWSAAADRRELLGIAKVLEVIAVRLDGVAMCEEADEQRNPGQDREIRDKAAEDVIHTLIERSPPSLQISDEDLQEHFPDIRPLKSSFLDTVYRMGDQQVDSSPDTTSSDCKDRMAPEQLDSLRAAVEESFRRAFS